MAERRRFEITDVSGGMNPDRHPLYIEENEAADLINFRVDRVGSLVGRQGRQKYGIDAPEGVVILALGRWVGTNRLQDYRTLVALSDGTLRVVDPLADPDTDEIGEVVYSGLDSDAQGMFLEVENLVLYANGVDGIVIYDGFTAFPMDIPPPASVLAGAGSGTDLTGTYKYAASYVSTTLGWETAATPSTPASIPVNNVNVELTIAGSEHPMVDRINIYRTTDGGNTLMFLASIPNEPAATYTDDGSVALSPLVTPVVDTIVPGEDMGIRAENIAYHKGRLWASVGDELYWSRPYQLNLFPYFTNTKVPFEGNDTIRALKSFQDYLLVFGEMNTILVAGDGGTSGLDIQLVRQDTDLGATSRHAMVEVDNQLLFLSARGLHVFPGFGEFAPKLTRHICEATVGCRADASMVYVPEERSVWLAITDQTWNIHLPNQGISRYDFFMRKPLSGGVNGVGAPVWVEAVHSRVAPSNAKFLNIYEGHTDFGEPINYFFSSRMWTLGAPDLVKYWRRIGLFANTGGQVEATIICDDTLRRYSLLLGAEPAGTTSLWSGATPSADADLWDSAVWSVEGLAYYRNALPAHSLYGRTMQLNLTAASEDGIEIHSPITFTYRASDRFLGR